MNKSKLITMKEAVDKYTYDGMYFAHGGALPVGSDCISFFREMVKAGRKDIDIASNCNTQGTNLLAAVGGLKRMEVGFSGLEVYGFANGLKRAVESGQTILEDYSNGSIPIRMMAGALNWPFVPMFMNTGCDQQWASADDPENYPNTKKIPEITDPFTGKVCGAFTPIKPDVAAIHVTMADIYGNAIMLGTEWCRYELSRCSKKVILCADKIVDTGVMKQFPNLVRIPYVVVDAVVYAPYGVWPACSTGLYDSDEEHMFYMNKMLKTEEGTQEYLQAFGQYDDVWDYVDMIGKERIDKISATETAFLMDPYRQWIKTDAEIKELLERR